MATEKKVSVKLAVNNLELNGERMEGVKGKVIEVSPRDAETMKRHGFIETEEKQNG